LCEFKESAFEVQRIRAEIFLIWPRHGAMISFPTEEIGYFLQGLEYRVIKIWTCIKATFFTIIERQHDGLVWLAFGSYDAWIHGLNYVDDLNNWESADLVNATLAKWVNFENSLTFAGKRPIGHQFFLMNLYPGSSNLALEDGRLPSRYSPPGIARMHSLPWYST
jgi:hypothetical protein